METLDRCFENVCELDIIFHVDKVCGFHFDPSLSKALKICASSRLSLCVQLSDGLVVSGLSLLSVGFWFNLQFKQKLRLFQQPRRFRIMTLNKEDPLHGRVIFSVG